MVVPVYESRATEDAAKAVLTTFHVLKWLGILFVIGTVFLIVARILISDAYRAGGVY